MPHISVKMLEGRSEEQKKQLAQALEKTLSETLGCATTWVTVSIEDYSAEQWQDVFKKEVSENEENLYKKAQYDPKILL
ncbi:MAG: 4-oxalocrotonate tautomerase [Ruminococcaceae bacterium]|nr:4-oxalocrotonate tautomerase [Oscillospiraceae bacterium]